MSGGTKDSRALRERWRDLRRERLALKAALRDRGLDAAAIRCDQRYRALVREQRRYATLLRHLNMQADRNRARGRS